MEEGKLSAFEYSERMQKAREWAERIIRLPFVRKVSLTGSMATNQATKQSDIDFFIQVEEGNLWWIRLAITIWIHLVGERRTDISIANKLCLNWFAIFDGPSARGRPHVVLAERIPIIGLTRLSMAKNVKCQMSNVKSMTNDQISNDEPPRSKLRGIPLLGDGSFRGLHPRSQADEVFGLKNNNWSFGNSDLVGHSEIRHSSLEQLIKPFSPFLEFFARNIQHHRFTTDPRTHLKNSQVRFSNHELGFHPPKTHTAPAEV